MTREPRRTYIIQKFYVVQCSECNENITERSGEPTTRAEAEQCKREHEAWHRDSDKLEAERKRVR